MMEHKIVSMGTLSPPRAIHRILRLVFGLALIGYVVWQVPKYGVLVGTEFPMIWGKWVGVLILFYFFADVFNVALSRAWGRMPQLVFLALLGAALLMDYALYGTLWGPPAGWLVYAMQQFTAAVIGIGFLLSAVLATPG